MILRDKAGLWCLGDGLSCVRDLMFCLGIGWLFCLGSWGWIDCFGVTWEHYWALLVWGDLGALGGGLIVFG